MQNNNTIFSYHTFMLPFSFNTKDKNDIIKNWEQKQYNITYNQQTYFHQFFKDSIFKDTEYFEHKKYHNTNLTMIKSKEYNLILESANLRLFDTNIGILTLNIKNTNYDDIDSILEINDFIRRLYPEYLDYKNEKSALVPKSIILDNIKEDFIFDKNKQNFTISKIIQQFLPTEQIIPSLDDKMFVISFYQNPHIAQQLKDDFTTNDDWYKYIFIDGHGKTVQNNVMQKKLLYNATYPRWQQYGTMYGMTRYSFVCLASDDMPLKHIQTIYYNMFSLLLMLRATLLKFSTQVSKIAKDIGKQDISEDVDILYKKYIQFVNGFYFREITAKDQGLELYEMGMNLFQLQRDIKDLDSEIEELHNYIERQTEKSTSKSLEFLNYLGGALLPPSILTGFFGMNTIDSIKGTFIYENSIYIIAISALIVPIYIKFFKRDQLST